MLGLDGHGPLYQQVYRTLRDEILSGRLAPGEKVLSTRALASFLKVSRNTAVLGFEQLVAEGYIESRRGAGGSVVVSALQRSEERRVGKEC